MSIAGFVTASYGYDALDRRMSKTTGGSTTRFLHAGSDEIAEYTSTGTLLRRYVPAPGTDERAAMIDSGSASPPATAIKYPHTDRQGSVMAVTSSTGAVTERFAYDGFGRSSSAFSGYPFRYTGQRLDFESGLMFYKARVYSTALGRFLQTDPIGTKDDLNLYAYVGNDPVNKTDPTGMCESCPADELIDNGAFANARQQSGNAFAFSGWQWLKENHPVGAPARTYDAVVEGDVSSAAWSVATAGAGKAVGWAAQGLKGGYAWVRQGLNKVDCCFAEGTLIATKAGLRPIEEIKVGDLVLSRDEKTGETAYKPVTALVPRHDRVIWTVTLSIAGGKTGEGAREAVYETTDDHPWRLATGVWAQTADLDRGMRVARADDSAGVVVSVLDTGRLGPVYNLEVAEFHTYFVGQDRVWVHNGGPCDRRVTLRTDTRRKIEANQPRNSQGQMIDPNTGEPLKPGKIDTGHKPGEEWRRRKTNHEAAGSTRQEVIETENDPNLYHLEDRSSNRSRRYEQ